MSRTAKRLVGLMVAPMLVYVGITAWVVSGGLNDHLTKSDVALVLGSKVELDGRPSVRLQARLDRAVELYRQGWFPTLIVSGGLGKEGYDEGVVMRQYLVSQGIPAERVITDSQGTTTYASAVNTRALAAKHHFKSVMVVSQWFHLPRCRLALERCGLGPISTAHARLWEWRDIYSSLRETLGYFSYWRRSFGAGA